jgi:hypothetical protein
MLKIRLYALLGALGLAALLGVVSTIAWTTADAPVVDFSAARPFAQGHAVAITEAWLQGKATTLPVADGVDARFNEQASGGLQLTIRSVSPANWTRDTVQGRVVETQYVLVDAVEMDLVVALPFVFDRGTPVLAAYPTALPASTASPAAPLEYQEVPVIDSIPQPVRDRVASWGAAYGANDGAAMRDLADDLGATAAQYRGLGGLTLVSTPEIRVAVPTATGLVLRVRFTFKNKDGAGMVSDLDMLVTAPDSFTPRIVAWGPAGAGPSLQPYANRSI